MGRIMQRKTVKSRISKAKKNKGKKRCKSCGRFM